MQPRFLAGGILSSRIVFAGGRHLKSHLKDEMRQDREIRAIDRWTISKDAAYLCIAIVGGRPVKIRLEIKIAPAKESMRWNFPRTGWIDEADFKRQKQKKINLFTCSKMWYFGSALTASEKIRL